MDTDTAVMTVGQLARRWAMSQQSVMRLVKSGKLPGTFRAGHRYLVPIEVVETLEKEGSIG